MAISKLQVSVFLYVHMSKCCFIQVKSKHEDIYLTDCSKEYSSSRRSILKYTCVFKKDCSLSPSHTHIHTTDTPYDVYIYQHSGNNMTLSIVMMNIFVSYQSRGSCWRLRTKQAVWLEYIDCMYCITKTISEQLKVWPPDRVNWYINSWKSYHSLAWTHWVGFYRCFTTVSVHQHIAIFLIKQWYLLLIVILVHAL